LEPHTYYFQPSGAKNATADQAIMINSMTNGFAGKTIKTHKWQKWMTNTNNQNKTITALHNSRPTIGTIATSTRKAIAIVTPTKTNELEMIAVDQTRLIAPTPNRAVRAAQVMITTETVHTSTMRKRSTRKTNHTRGALRRTTHDIKREAYTQDNTTQSTHNSEKQKTINSKNKIKNP
jgi:hypothetical protein